MNSIRWSVVEEFGIDYAPRADAPAAQHLHCPVYAAQATDGTYLIVDELCSEKPIPFRMEYRTVRVDRHGQIVFDTSNQGIDDGYGCLVAGQSVAILRRTKWELLLISPHGETTDCIDLTALSKRMPRLVSWTERDTFLIVFLDRSRRLDIVEIDRQGRLVWYLPPRANFLGVPASVQLSSTDTLVVADAFRHVVLEFDRDGEVVWQFGQAGNPAKTSNRVSGASCVRELADGRRLISDTRNHRLLLVETDGTSSPAGPPDGQLCDPAYADRTRRGHLLICDSGNGRVVELDDQQRIVWQYGTPLRTRRSFSFPRSIEVTGAGEYLIADTANDRVVRAADGSVQEDSSCAQVGLFWPRCVRQLPSGSLLIADGRRGRVVEVAQNGQVLNQLAELKSVRFKRLGDPHDVRMLSNGHLLITDSSQDVVLEVNWSGNIQRIIGDAETVDLDDPHSAQQLGDGRIVICDTGHHRVVYVDEQGICVESIDMIVSDSFVLKMNRPRYMEMTSEGTMIIVDTGNNRVLAATPSGQLLWLISDLPDSPLPRLYQPRWATQVSPDEVVVCDHFHHRMVRLRRR